MERVCRWLLKGKIHTIRTNVKVLYTGQYLGGAHLRRTRAPGLILAWVLCYAVMLASCSGSEAISSWDLTAKQMDIIKAANPEKNPDAARKRKDTLVIGTTDFIGVFNPLWGETAYDASIAANIFGSLIEPDFDARPIPGMADFEISEDNLTYTLHLKKGVRFSDGSPMTAEDVAFTYYVLCDPSYDGSADVASVQLLGWRDYVEGRADTISGIQIINDSTIQFRLEKPNAQAIWFFSSGVLSKAYYGRDFKKGNVASVKALIDKPMGAGPYMLEAYSLGESVSLTANPNYYKGKPKIKHIIYSVTPTGQELERVKLGEVDLDFPGVNEENIAAAKEQGFITIYRYPSNGYGYIGFRNDEPKYKDLRVRQALLMAIDRKGIVEAIYGPYANVINIPQSRLSWAYTDEDINPYEYNLEEAARLFEEAGWSRDADGRLVKNGEPFKIVYSAIQGHPVTDAMLPVMKDDYQKLGIDLEIAFVDWPTLTEMVALRACDMWFMAWGLSPDPDPSDVYHTNGPMNWYNYSNTEADTLMQKALETTDMTERKALYKEIYQLINHDVPCFWIYQRSDMWAVNCRVQNFKASPYREWYYGIDEMSLAP